MGRLFLGERNSPRGLSFIVDDDDDDDGKPVHILYVIRFTS